MRAAPVVDETTMVQCRQLAVNGGFESDDGWERPLTAQRAVYTGERASEGQRSLLVGIPEGQNPLYSDSTAYQWIGLPANAETITVDVRVWRSTSGSNNAFQYFWIKTARRNLTVFQGRSNDETWNDLTVDLSEFRGERIRLLFGAYNTGGNGSAAMYVDEVAVHTCQTEGPTPTATPTAVPSETVTTTTPMPLSTPVYLPLLRSIVPAATPTEPAPSCQQLLINGDFEGGTGWSLPQTPRPGRFSSEQVQAGLRSLRLGIPLGEGNALSDSTAYQWVQLPANAEHLVLRAFVWRGSSGSDSDFHYFWLTPSGGATVKLFQQRFDERSWEEITLDISHLAGQRVRLLFGTYNNGAGGNAVMYVDDVSVEHCDATLPTPFPSPTPGDEATPRPPAEMRSPDYGANAFLWWRPEIAQRDLSLMTEAGFGWVRQSFAWEDIEQGGKGAFLWETADRVVQEVNTSGLALLVRLGTDPELTEFWAGAPPASLDDFVDFVAAVAQRYNCTPQAVGCIDAYQIWNEPNLAREWGGNRPSPSQYANLLRRTHAVIKSANPNAMVITAGMAPTGTDNAVAMPDDKFYEGMYQAMGGNSDSYFDLLGVHAPGFAAPPELDPAEVAADPDLGGHRFFAFRHVEDIRAIMVRYGDGDKRIAILEFGWTTDPVNPDYSWFGAGAGIDELVKADYLVRAYEWAEAHWQPWIGLMSVLTMPNLDWLNDGDPEDEEQYWWAILEPSAIDELRLRPAYVALCLFMNERNEGVCPYDPGQ